MCIAYVDIHIIPEFQLPHVVAHRKFIGYHWFIIIMASPPTTNVNIEGVTFVREEWASGNGDVKSSSHTHSSVNQTVGKGNSTQCRDSFVHSTVCQERGMQRSLPSHIRVCYKRWTWECPCYNGEMRARRDQIKEWTLSPDVLNLGKPRQVILD